MKKNILWMLAAILISGLTVTTMTSCSNNDDPVNPDPVITQTLTGEWFAVVNRMDYDKDADENDIEYILLSFDENGVVTQNIYTGNTTEPLRYWERMHRHGIYTVDEKARTITVENISETPTTSKYSFDKELQILNLYDEETVDRNMSIPLHRPSKAEKDLLAVYDISLWGDDYVGKWFGYTEHNGLYTYMMLDFTEGRGLKTIRYSVYNDNVTRTEYTQVYNEADDDEYEDEPVLEIHSPTDYKQSEFYWWEVAGNTLTLGKELEDEEFISSTYHALTKADIELMEELDKKSLGDLAEKIQGKWMMAETDGKPVPTDSKQVITYESGSKLYYSLSINAISDLNVWVNHCEGSYVINGNKLSQVVELPDANIKFTQSPQILSITDDDMYLITNNETFVDGKSHRITKDMNERKVRVTHDYSADIIGTWEGRQTSEEDVHSDGQLHRWEYKSDGTFVYYRQDDNGEWVADVNSMAEYFVDGVLLCTRWKNVGNDTEYRESWEISSIENGKMKWTAIRQKADGSTYTADFSMTRL